MPEERDLIVGDKVRAEGVGYVMEVVEIYPPFYVYRYRCTWTAQDGSAQHDLFRSEQLNRAENS